MKQTKKQIVGVHFKENNNGKTYYYYDICGCKIGDEALVEVCGQRKEVKVVSIVKELNRPVEKFILCKIDSEYIKLRDNYRNCVDAISFNRESLLDCIMTAFDTMELADLIIKHVKDPIAENIKTGVDAIKRCETEKQRILEILGAENLQ